MNTILTFLDNNRERLGLSERGVPDQLTSLMITPRFRASSHVVCLLFPVGEPTPVLVAKLPRIAGHSASIVREGENLLAIQASRPGGFNSIPQVVAFESTGESHILVETALTGQAMDQNMVRRQPVACCQAIVRWLLDLPLAPKAAEADPDWFERLIERPLHYLKTALSLATTERKLLEKTQEQVESLRQAGAGLPLVCEHGDLSHPNIFFQDGRVGVVDWEMAEPLGLPAYDLFFFLTYVAFARHKARSTKAYLAAYHNAFFSQQAWTLPYIESYARQVDVSPAILTPLFIAAWVRYLAGLLRRLSNDTEEPTLLAPETAAWLRANRYYTLWQYAIAHMDELAWNNLPAMRSH